MVKFYKDNTSGVFYVNDTELTPGMYEIKFSRNDTAASIYDTRSNTVFLGPTYITEFTDKDGIPYANIEEFKAVSLHLMRLNTFGEVQLTSGPVDIQNPMPSDGDSIYVKDIDFTNSDFTGWVGNPEDLFTSPFNTGIENTSIDNPKSISIAFNRTVYSSEMGFGCNNIAKSFGTDIIIEFLGSGDVVRKTISSLGGNPNSRLIPFGKEAYNKIIIKFPTSDPVLLTNITARKIQDSETAIKGTDPNGNLRLVNTNFLGNLLISLDEQKDAFGRLKTAEPYTIFDSSLTTSISDILFWSELVNGTASSVYIQNTSSKTLSVSTIGDFLIRQTKQRFKYQPAKSHEFFITGIFSTETGVRKRAGLLDYDNKGLVTIDNTPQNGVFFENNGGILSWCIVNNGVVSETVEQSNWNLDTLDGTGQSGFTLNINAVNIITGQLEWLGVGVVLVGFATGGGAVAYCHAFQHASVSGFEDVYMRTANLPVAYSIEALSGTGSMKAICSSVISGGGFNPRGDTDASFNTTDVAVSSGDSELLVGLRLQEDAFEYTIEPNDLSILSLANGNTQWVLCINPTYSGSVTWNNKPNTVVQEAFNNGNLVTDFGKIISAGSFSNNNDSLDKVIDTSQRIGKDLLGNRDEVWLVVTALGNESYRGTINFKQLI